MINKTKLKKKFNQEGIQLPIKSMNILNDQVSRMVDKWIRNTKDSGIRRLTPDLTAWIIK